MWNDFFLDSATNLKDREIFLVKPVFSLTLVCNLKHLSCKQFHNNVKRRFYILKKFKEIAKYSWLKQEK